MFYEGSWLSETKVDFNEPSLTYTSCHTNDNFNHSRWVLAIEISHIRPYSRVLDGISHSRKYAFCGTNVPFSSPNVFILPFEMQDALTTSMLCGTKTLYQCSHPNQHVYLNSDEQSKTYLIYVFHFTTKNKAVSFSCLLIYICYATSQVSWVLALNSIS